MSEHDRRNDDDDDDDRPRRTRRDHTDDDDRPRRTRRNHTDDDDDDRPRRKRRDNTDVPCPECGGHSVRRGPWPWYLGSVGAIVCKAVICNECGHEYDEKKPRANLATRKRNLAIVINAVGLLGIVTVIGLLVLWIRFTIGGNN